jgi:hypothetical protein
MTGRAVERHAAQPVAAIMPRAILRGGKEGADMEARCQCGQLSVALPGPSPATVVCHCGYCQRRTGSPFGILAYYPSEMLTITGQATLYARPAASGGTFESFFCPVCGSTVYARAGKHPAMLGVAVGAFNDPHYPAPVRSVWEEGKHDWVVIPGKVERFDRGRD